MVNPWRRSFTINKACFFENGARASEAEGFWGVGDFVLLLGDVFFERAGPHALVLRCRQYLSDDVSCLYYGVGSACWMASVATIDKRVCRSRGVSFAAMRRMEDSAWLPGKKRCFRVLLCVFVCVCYFAASVAAVAIVLRVPAMRNAYCSALLRGTKEAAHFFGRGDRVGAQGRGYGLLLEADRWVFFIDDSPS